jgi:lipopolysaccharide cholinephosphotransferase
MDRSKFGNFIYGDFEGRRYKIPSGYDEWLTKLYGDYMKLPPLKEQKTHHHFEAFVKD